MQWRAEDYISFVCKFLLGMGLGFELPVVILTLVKIGVLDYAMLSKARRYMIVINLILGAVLTTPEPITQIVMFVPLQGLYELTVWIAWYWDQPDRARARRKLLLALLVVLLIAVAAWEGFKYGWPAAAPALALKNCQPDSFCAISRFTSAGFGVSFSRQHKKRMRNAMPLLAAVALAAAFTPGCAGPEEKLGRGIEQHV